MELKERLEQASGYRGVDFHSVDSIGVICRGPSVYRFDLCCEKFNHCYLSGEFNHTLYKIEDYLMGKDIILCVMQQFRYRTSEQNCKKFNINNLQVQAQEGTNAHKRCIDKFPDLKVSGYVKKHYEIIADINEMNGYSEDRNIYSTGISGIISALYFSPKDIYVIGMDFYNKRVKPYFIKEDMDVFHVGRINKSIKGLREGMLKSIRSICDLFPDINVHLYTTYEGIRSRNNLNVRYV